MPNRIVREAILDSDRYHSLRTDSERLLFHEILLLADDYGIAPANYGFLRRRTSVCLSKSTDQVAGFLESLMAVDLVRVYEIGDARYLYIPRFGNVPRSRKPKWPIPPDEMGGNEIKELQKKRTAYAVRLPTSDTQLHANVAETETETETGTEVQDQVLVLNTASSNQNLVGQPLSPVSVLTSPTQVLNQLVDTEKKTTSLRRASRIATDWALPLEWGEWAMRERPTFTNGDAARMADRFRDYWIAKPGKDGTKLDWFATWRNWVRSETRIRGSPASVSEQNQAALAEWKTQHSQRIIDQENET